MAMARKAMTSSMGKTTAVFAVLHVMGVTAEAIR
jgi:hypothetical protein